MAERNLGICTSCRATVPVEHVLREGHVYLRKKCAECGVSESLISTDADAWRKKRRVYRYDSSDGPECTLDCTTCRRSHGPAMVFVDVTNRCNMNCPICIANIPAMGFRFEPPLEYFRKIFAFVGGMEPRPRVNLFGGEPTVRDDLIEIIQLARRHALSPRIVTNGLRLAHEDYCRELCSYKVPLLFALDGLSADVYDRLRHNPSAFQKKMKALDNLRRYSKRRNTIMTCVARRINEDEMPRLIRYCHENRGMIKAMHMIPLTETWEEGQFETDVATTIEDVERIVDDAFPDATVEFWSAGLPGRLAPAVRFFGSTRLTFRAVHPNCESMTMLLSDGERYRPLSDFTTGSVNELMAELVDRVLELEPFLSALDPRRPAHRALAIFRCVGAVAGRLFRFVRWRALAKGNPVVAGARFLLHLARGRRPKDALRANTCVGDVLRMVVLPFEEYHSVESERLRHCRAAFAYLDPETDEPGLVPVCSWSLVREDIQRRLSARWRTADAAPAHAGGPNGP